MFAKYWNKAAEATLRLWVWLITPTNRTRYMMILRIEDEKGNHLASSTIKWRGDAWTQDSALAFMREAVKTARE